MYTGAPGTMVIRITYDGKNIKYDWVEDHWYALHFAVFYGLFSY
jgi:hypothetical protein